MSTALRIPAAGTADPPSTPARRTRTRRLRLLAALLLVALLVLLAVTTVVGRADRQQADDPRSSTPSGTGALGQLLSDEGVEVQTTDRLDDAVTRSGASSTLVVADADVLTETEAARVLASPAARVVLLRPNTPALTRFGVRARGVAPSEGVVDPVCGAAGPQRAGAVELTDLRAAYAATGPADLTCYPVETGFAYVRASTATGRAVDLLAGGISNAQLDGPGNAALGLDVLGSQPEVVWLMARSSSAAAGSDDEPTLLPPWWAMAVVQTVLGLVAVGIWRGRRLGPILTEPLPVTVRAAETVEGHGRLYERIAARDRAAEALRHGTRARLSRAFGYRDDPLALSAAVGARTGRDPVQVRDLLFGPAPDTDDHLVELTRHLDRLEQEARQP